MGYHYVPIETITITPSCGDCGWRGTPTTSDRASAADEFQAHAATSCLLNAAVGYHDPDDWPQDESFHPRMDAAMAVYAVLRSHPCQRCGESRHWCEHRQPGRGRDVTYDETQWERPNGDPR